MKSRKWIWIPVLVLVIVLGNALTVGAATGTPGSAEDPVVTKSYVETFLRNAVKEEVTAQMATYEGPTAASEGSTEFTVLELKTGESVLGGSGTEIIVRAGRAVSIGNGANGLADVTQALDVLDGEPVGNNHLLICPRDDGRGIMATTDNCWVMVRGTYVVR